MDKRAIGSGAVRLWLRVSSALMPWRGARLWLSSFAAEEPMLLGCLSRRAQAIALALAPAAMSEMEPAWPEFALPDGTAQDAAHATAMSLVLARAATRAMLPRRGLLDWVAPAADVEAARAGMARPWTDRLVEAYGFPHFRPNVSMSKSVALAARTAECVDAVRLSPGAAPRLRQALAFQIAEFIPGSYGAMLSMRAYLAAPGMTGSAVDRARQAFGAHAVEELALNLGSDWLALAERMGRAQMIHSVEAGSGGVAAHGRFAGDSQGWLSEAVLQCQLLNGTGASAGLARTPGQLASPEVQAWAQGELVGALGALVRLGLPEDKEPLVWRLATDNNPAAILGLSAWGYGLDEAGPDGLRPIDIAVRKGRPLLFRALIAAGADASTKAPRAKKSPIELGRKLLREDLGPDLLARAEREAIKTAVAVAPELAEPEEAPEPAAEGQADAAHQRRRVRL